MTRVANLVWGTAIPLQQHFLGADRVRVDMLRNHGDGGATTYRLDISGVPKEHENDLDKFAADLAQFIDTWGKNR